MMLETISCPVCEGNDFKTKFKSRDFRFNINNTEFDVVSCAKCNFIFLNPRPDKDCSVKFYPGDFNKNEDSLFFRVIEPCFRFAEDSTIKFLIEYCNFKRILDIGCGNGNFILRLFKNGYDAYGVEQNAGARKYADPRIESRILYKDINECNFPSHSFDVVTMFHSLEHIYDMNGLFSEINRILKPGGYLYICVPDADFFESRLFGPYYYNLEVPRHLYFFTKKSISNFLTRHNFKVELFSRDYISDLVTTPASIYYGIWYFFMNKKIPVSKLIRIVCFIPMVLIRFVLRFFFLFQSQNLKVLAYKTD